MEHIRDLFGNTRIAESNGRKGVGGGERGALLRYFCENLNPPRIASGYKAINERGLIKILPFMNDLRSLFWLKSVCEDAQRRGYSFSKRFWYYAKQQKHVDELEHSGKL